VRVAVLGRSVARVNLECAASWLTCNAPWQLCNGGHGLSLTPSLCGHAAAAASVGIDVIMIMAFCGFF
jgi:hypothetical protein